MVLERAEIPVVPGREAEFEQVMVKGLAILTAAPGAHSVRLGRGVENPSKFLLLIEWDSVDAHVAFTKTPEFATFVELASPLFGGAPAMEHFAP